MVTNMSSKILINCIKDGFQESLKQSKHYLETPISVGRKHNLFSKIFIENVHNKIERDLLNLPEYQNYICFSRTKSCRKFNRSELLFDIHICETDKLQSSKHAVSIPFIKKSFIAIESEFAQNLTESTIDFSKLVCSSAAIKCMILPYSPNFEKNYLDPLKLIARNISGELFCLFVPHPNTWNSSGSARIIVKRKFQNDIWQEL
jgi:hypothetical protein